MICGLIEASSGQILYRGEPIERDRIAHKQRLGYVPEEPQLYPHLTGAEYLEMVGQLRGLPETRLAEKIHGFLRLFWLYEDRHVPISFGAGKVVLFSSHELETVERVCSHVVILHKGRVVANDSIEQLRNLMSLPTLEEIFSQRAIEQDSEGIARRLVQLIEA